MLLAGPMLAAGLVLGVVGLAVVAVAVGVGVLLVGPEVGAGRDSAATTRAR